MSESASERLDRRRREEWGREPFNAERLPTVFFSLQVWIHSMNITHSSRDEKGPEKTRGGARARGAGGAADADSTRTGEYG